MILFLALLAQLLSGAAAIVNQTVWQRALIVYLAGSEAVSSMIVVLAFMLGLGAGALWIGRTAHRFENPARGLALVELLLGCTNLLVLALLSLDAGDTLPRLQRLSLSFGLPQRVGYALVSCATLLGPCFLMGVTSPLMSEVAQRQLRLRDSRILVVVFFANSIGAFVGGLATGFYLMPILGQKACLSIAIAFNLVTGLLLLALSRWSLSPAPSEAGRDTGAHALSRPQPIDLLGFTLGFLALAYEMFLYRAVSLAFEPKPYTFATVLCLYLLLWSIGVLLARWIPWGLPVTLALTSLLLAPVQTLSWILWTTRLDPGTALLALGFWLPCLGFGVAFGQLVIRAAVLWGNDIGRLYGWNTLGSCLGILAGVLLGYEFQPGYALLAIGVGYLLLAVRGSARFSKPERRGLAWPALLAVAAGLWVTQVAMLIENRSTERAIGARIYFGREGVVEVRGGRSMFWSGLGHGRLSRERDHVGSPDWRQAVVPLLAHGGTRDKDVLVVGLGTGITVGTLASSLAVRSVDVYEINPVLKRLLTDYPEGTLWVGGNPKVRLLWRDGRTGLALAEKRYDVITQAPLYLRQAGSSLLLSREYMRLVRSRLKPGGVYAIYSNAMGHGGQLLLVRRTAREVFKHCRSFGGGYLTLGSDSPFEFSATSIEENLAAAGAADALAREVQAFGVAKLAAYLDGDPSDWGEEGLAVTDDRPLVEYPALADRVVARRRFRETPPSQGEPRKQ